MFADRKPVAGEAPGEGATVVWVPILWPLIDPARRLVRVSD
jgi:hypothetical protein